jgi:hypothetical protein
MRTFIYKRTHEGDPNASGVFGIHDCMGQKRTSQFDAVIGVGGTDPWPECRGIARKVNWIGIGPQWQEVRKLRSNGRQWGPRVTFDHFAYYGENGPLLEDIAPSLAKRLYDRKARFVMDNLSDRERREVDSIVDLAKEAPPSAGLGPKESPARRC